MHLHGAAVLHCCYSITHEWGLEELLGTVETWVSMMSPALLSLHGLESCKHPQPPLTSTNEDPEESNTDIFGGHQQSLSSAAVKGSSTARYSSNPFPIENIDRCNGIRSQGRVLLWTEEFNWSKIQSTAFNSTTLNSGDQFCCCSVDLRFPKNTHWKDL